MDGGSDWLRGFPDLVPEPVLAALRQQVVQPHAILEILKRSAAAGWVRLADTATWSAGTGAVSSPVAAVAVLVLALVVMNAARRLAAWAARVALRAAFWAAVVALLAVVALAGPVAALRVAVAVASRVAATVSVLTDVWMREYHRLENQQQGAAAGARPRNR